MRTRSLFITNWMKKCDCVLLCFAHSLLHFLSNQIVCVCVLTQYIHPSIYIERLVTVFLSIWISAVYLRTGLFMHNTAINVYEYSVNSFLALYSFLGIQLCELCTKSTFFHPLIKLIRSNGFVMQRFFLMSFLAHRLIFSTVCFLFVEQNLVIACRMDECVLRNSAWILTYTEPTNRGAELWLSIVLSVCALNCMHVCCSVHWNTVCVRAE